MSMPPTLLQPVSAEINLISNQVIGCAFRVSNTMGCGFLEKVYENALAHEIRKLGLSVRQQAPIAVYYDGVVVGDYLADILVEDCFLIETKVVKALDSTHMAQCLNYLRASNLPLCLLINFAQPKLEYKRIINTNHAKHE